MKILRYSKLVCFVIGAVLIFVFRDFFVHNLRWFIGGLMALYGAIGLAEVIIEKEKPIYDRHGFLFYCVEILIGSIVLIFVTEFSTVCIIWAVWSFFRESVELKEIVAGELHPALAVISGAESIAVIVLSVMLLTEPGMHHAMSHTYFLCIELVLASSIPVVNHLVPSKHGGKHDNTETDATDRQTDAEQTETVDEPVPSDEEAAVRE